MIEAETALALTPNLANAQHMRASALFILGRQNEALPALQTSIRLDPSGPLMMVRRDHVVATLYQLRRYEATINAARDVIRLRPNHPPSYRWLAAAHGQLGQIDEAKAALEKAIAIGHASFDMYVRHRAPFWRPESHAHMIDGLRKAGSREA